ncbi:MAG: spore protease YyaC [Clostridiales bacterium]|jgi:putative sporulation protein YyaC|nr:spore protease YyaC [Clostridiales bacterium]
MVSKVYFMPALTSAAVMARTLFRLSRTDTALPVVLCVGSDRLTGDCLGPLVGKHLTDELAVHTFVYGTLDAPVTALNLSATAAFIRTMHPDAKLWVVDAALGRAADVGRIRVHRGALQPGEAMGKRLPAVGDVAITAIVGAADNPASLAAARLQTVYTLAQFIAGAITHACALREAT